MNLQTETFHIIERGSAPHLESSAEEKQDVSTYSDEVSIEYAYAQSVLTVLYGLVETGHRTTGHECVSEREMFAHPILRDAMLYGELLPRGLNKALSAGRLAAESASVLFDLGSGTGKVPIQAFLQFGSLQRVFGVELSQARYDVSEAAVLKLVELLGKDCFSVDMVPGTRISITQTRLPSTEEDSKMAAPYSGSDGRSLTIQRGDMFVDVPDIGVADVVMLETEIPPQYQGSLCSLLRHTKMGARTLTYVDLNRMWTGGQCPFRRHDANKFLSDRYSTSWSVLRGHHFFLFTKV
jgi:hypothetical protein